MDVDGTSQLLRSSRQRADRLGRRLMIDFGVAFHTPHQHTHTRSVQMGIVHCRLGSLEDWPWDPGWAWTALDLKRQSTNVRTWKGMLAVMVSVDQAWA
jgi:hypothetical protein